MHRLTLQQARRIAVRAQLLDAERPADLLDTVRHLTLLQADMTAAVAPNADLVAWSRLGRSYAREELADALAGHALIELRSLIRPAEDIALHRAEMSRFAAGEVEGWQRTAVQWVEANDACRRDLLQRLDRDGPSTARDLPDTCAVAWKSSGWNHDRNVSMLLEMMELRGEVVSVGHRGRDRLWDLADRVFPDDAVVPYEDAMRLRAELRLRSLGLARAKAAASPTEPSDVGEAGEPAEIEGVRGFWRVDPAALDERPFVGRIAVLSPLDRLVYDRKRMLELFAFDYQLEMYKPRAKRRWGYFALPVLDGDALVGKVDATADIRRGVLRVDAIHEDEPFPEERSEAVRDELSSLAACLDLEVDLRGG